MFRSFSYFQVLDNDKAMKEEEKDPDIIRPDGKGGATETKQKSGCCS